MALFIPAPNTIEQKTEDLSNEEVIEIVEQAKQRAQNDELPHIKQKLTFRVTLEGPEMASKAFHICARLLQDDHQKNPIDYEISLMSITRVMNGEPSSPRWEYLYNFVANKR